MASATLVAAGPRLAGRGGNGPCFIGGEDPCFGASSAPGLQAGAKLRTLTGAYGPSAYGRSDRENSVTLISAWGDRSAAVATSPPTWCVGATSPPTWCVVSQIGALAWRSEPARLEPAHLAGAARLPGGARAPCGPGTRRHRHTRQSLRGRHPPRGDEQARGSRQPCRFPKRAQRGGHLRPTSRPRGRPVLPWRSVRAAQHPPARGLQPQPPVQLRARTSGPGYPRRLARKHRVTLPGGEDDAWTPLGAERGGRAPRSI
jgi:hypothetical protein